MQSLNAIYWESMNQTSISVPYLLHFPGQWCSICTLQEKLVRRPTFIKYLKKSERIHKKMLLHQRWHLIKFACNKKIRNKEVIPYLSTGNTMAKYLTTHSLKQKSLPRSHLLFYVLNCPHVQLARCSSDR